MGLLNALALGGGTPFQTWDALFQTPGGGFRHQKARFRHQMMSLLPGAPGGALRFRPFSDIRGPFSDAREPASDIRGPVSTSIDAPHPGEEMRANLKSISHRCHLFEVAFVWELTKETIHLPLGCLQGGFYPLGGTPFALEAPFCLANGR